MRHVVTDVIWGTEFTEPRDKLVALALSRSVTHVGGLQCRFPIPRLVELTGLPVAEIETSLQSLERQEVIAGLTIEDDPTATARQCRARFTAQFAGRR